MPAPVALPKSPPGEIKFTLAAAAVSGDVIPRPAAASGTSIAIVLGLNSDNFVSGTLVPCATLGEFDMQAITGTAFTDDQLLYWDNTAKKITNVSTNNCRAGRCVGAKASAAATCRVNINAV